MTPRTKGLVQKWLVEQGLNASRVEEMRERTIRRLYVDPAFLRSMKTRRDYCPSAGRHQAPQRATQAAEHPTQAPTWDVQEEKPMVQAPVKAMPDPMAAFAAALQTIVPPGVSEERVLQLIYDHVPGLIKLALAEHFGALASRLMEDGEDC
jgi:hypothetical protein